MDFFMSCSLNLGISPKEAYLVDLPTFVVDGMYVGRPDQTEIHANKTAWVTLIARSQSTLVGCLPLHYGHIWLLKTVIAYITKLSY